MFTILSCEHRQKNVSLYPIDSIINDQIHFLAEHNARLFKRSVLQSKTDSVQYVPGDTIAWGNELNIFKQIDAINKSINAEHYLIDDNLYDPSSNLTVKAFTAMHPMPVKYLKIYYQRSVNSPRKIEALVDEENSLYEGKRTLVLEFNQINDKSILTSYIVQGGQEMIMDDSVNFSIHGKINIR